MSTTPGPGRQAEVAQRGQIGNLMCVANFPANTGFAWTFIEELFAGLATRLQPLGVDTWVAYPALPGYPETLRDSPAEPLAFPVELGRPRALVKLGREVRRRNITMLYLCDRPTWHPAYRFLRLQGVKTIIVHDHTSGARDRPGPTKAFLKRALHMMPGFSADRFLAVSDFVAGRLLAVNRCPPNRVHRLWNSVEVPKDLPSKAEKVKLLSAMGLSTERPVVGCAARAAQVKGIFQLLRAFNSLWEEWEGEARPQLLYMGDGPAYGDITAAKDELACREAVYMPGYVPHAADVLGCVNVAVVPSLWDEAFGLAVLEPLARSVPVVASRVGGIPEVVDDGKSGLLVPPGDETKLANAIAELLRDPARARDLGRRGRERALRDFDRPVQLVRLERFFRAEIGV